MPIFETFAKRKQKAENAGKPIIYRYDVLPYGLRVQVAHIWRSAIGFPGDFVHPIQPDLWKVINNILVPEFEVFRLVETATDPNNHTEQCVRFLLESQDVDRVLSLIELSFLVIDTKIRQFRLGGPQALDVLQTPDNAIDDLNRRFLEHAIGYQYQGGQIIEVNSQYLHSETVEPAISLLHDARFEGALQEFMSAHKHYRERNNKEAITEALKAFESTMKTICDRRGWSYPQNATANPLIEVLFKSNLIPSEMQSHFSALRTTLESGVPTIRNRKAGHGQGSETVEVPDYLAAYALHLTATNIVFLINAHNSS